MTVMPPVQVEPGEFTVSVGSSRWQAINASFQLLPPAPSSLEALELEIEKNLHLVPGTGTGDGTRATIPWPMWCVCGNDYTRKTVSTSYITVHHTQLEGSSHSTEHPYSTVLRSYSLALSQRYVLVSLVCFSLHQTIIRAPLSSGTNKLGLIQITGQKAAFWSIRDLIRNPLVVHYVLYFIRNIRRSACAKADAVMCALVL
jgi:hypothetical protein